MDPAAAIFYVAVVLFISSEIGSAGTVFSEFMYALSTEWLSVSHTFHNLTQSEVGSTRGAV